MNSDPRQTQPAPYLRSIPLASWHDGCAKQSILDFVRKVTVEGSPDFVPPPERIAVFDNDGTLWSEKPFYFQGLFALDRIKALAPQFPEWKEHEPFASLLKGDWQGVLAGGEHALVKIVMASHAGMSTEQFEAIVKDWIATARHPITQRVFTRMVFQPMLELLAFLRASDFKTFIVSGGGVEFMRTFSERVYGIPPEQVIGSTIKTKFEVQDDKPVLKRLAELHFVDDNAGKPVGIHEQIGRRPIAVFGNSDGDFEMLEWVTSAPGPRFGLIVHHDDAEREFAYDRHSPCGKLDRALDAAPRRRWTVVSMKNDWRQIYPVEPA
jgi:phosphoserine phosphatase